MKLVLNNNILFKLILFEVFDLWEVLNEKFVVDLVIVLYILLCSVFLFESNKEDMKKVVIDDLKIILIGMFVVLL